MAQPTFTPKFSINQEVWYCWGSGLKKAKVVAIAAEQWVPVGGDGSKLEYAETYKVEDHKTKQISTIAGDMLYRSIPDALEGLRRMAEED